MMNDGMILKFLNSKKYSEVFNGATEQELKKEFKKLAIIAHPDKGGNTDLMTKLNEFYQLALESIGVVNAISSVKELMLTPLKGKSITYKYRETIDFELGKVLIGRNHITYLVDKAHKDLYNNAMVRIKSIKYPTKELEEINSKFMPTIRNAYETNDWYVLELHKTDDVHRLGLLKSFLDKLDIKHTAWVTTRLSNITSILEFNGLVHNGINIDNCFVSPQFHSIILNGGWWYCTKQGEKMIGTVTDVYGIMDVDTKANKISTNKTDLDSIKDIGRKLNGGSIIYTESNKDNLPKAIANWFNKASMKSSIDEYNSWEKAMMEGFGQRKFITLNISEDDMYKTGGN